jgi:hypothetical protein
MPDAEQVFDPVKRRNSSFHYYGGDSMTTVWRSDPVIAGSTEDIFGAAIGPQESGLTIGRSDIKLLPQLPIHPREGEGTRRKIYAELHSVRMEGDGVEFLAGEPFLKHLTETLKLTPEQIGKIFRRSFGEVIPWNLAGDPAQDFPADNHFNVFFALKYAATPERPAFTLFNREPVVVVDLGLTQLPPLGRVTIPQFPQDMPELWRVSHGGDDHLPPGEWELFGKGGCCAHSVRGDRVIGDLTPRFITAGELVRNANGLTDAGTLSLRPSSIKPMSTRPLAPPKQSLFRAVDGSYVDAVFVPNRLTQISSSGLLFAFDDTSNGGISESIQNDVSSKKAMIQVDPPNNTAAYQPPQQFGITLGANAGITFDIGKLREANPDFYLVAAVAMLGMNGDSPVGSPIRLRVLVDGVEVHFADKTFHRPGESFPISIDLQSARSYLTIVATSTSGSPNGVVALFHLRGFGQLSTDSLPAYSGSKVPSF